MPIVATDSEIAIADEAQALFSFYGLNSINRSQPVYDYTGKLVAKHRPEVYRIAVDLLAAGKHSRREMCQILHVTSRTLDSIEEEEAQTLTTLRAQAARRNMRLHHMSLDRLEELIPTMPDGAKVAVVAGITGEKAQLFAGEATARLERVEPVNLLERFGAFVHQLEQKVQARIIDSEATKLPPKCALGQPITSDNRDHIKSNCIDSEVITHFEAESYKNHKENPEFPAPAGTGEGAVAVERLAADSEG